MILYPLIRIFLLAGHSPAVGFVALTCRDSLPVRVDVVCAFAKTCCLNVIVHL